MLPFRAAALLLTNSIAALSEKNRGRYVHAGVDFFVCICRKVQPSKAERFTKTAPGFTKTAPGFMKTAPGFMKTDPGFMKTAPGIMKTAPGFMKTAPVS